MTEKNILIVDDETSILQVLKNSLRKQDEAYYVETATDGYIALEKLNQKKFHLVVTDYKMVGLNGLELLEAIRAIQPDTKVIMMTAYGSQELEDEAQRLNAHRFLHKPLEIDTFRNIVQEALADITINRTGILVLSEQRYRDVTTILEQVQNDVGARCTFLVDASGQIIVRTGDVRGFPIEAIASLLSGSVATLTEAGRALDGDEDTINLAYREGKDTNIYGLNIGRNLLMILVIERTKYSSKLGSVWYYAQSAAHKLTQELRDGDLTANTNLLDENSMQELDDEFDKLFSEEEIQEFQAGPKPDISLPDILGKKLNLPEVKEEEKTNQTKTEENKQAAPIQTFSFEEAVKRGLIPSDMNNPMEKQL